MKATTYLRFVVVESAWGLCYQSFVGFHVTVNKNFIHLNNPNNIGSNRNKEK